MRSPSARVLINACAIYPYVPSQDLDAGNDPAGNYPASVGTFACSYQCQSVTRSDESGRISSAFVWAVLLATSDALVIFADVDTTKPNFAADWRVDLINPDGSFFRSLYTDGSLDMAGRGSTTEVMCRETR